MANSTIAQPCNSSGLLSAASLANFSLVSVDWSNSKSTWVTGRPMDAESPLVAQAELLVSARADQRVWVYKNIVIAYAWFPTVRAKLVDPQYAGWFLHFGPPPLPNNSYHVPQCDDNFSPPLCSALYHSQDQTPGFPHGDGNCPAPNCDCGGVPCGFYLFNHANESLREWLIDEYVMGPTGVGNPAVHGVYLDDRFVNSSWSGDAPDCAASPIGGPSEVNAGCIADIGLTQAETTALADGWQTTMLQLQTRLLAAGAFSWAYFTEFRTPDHGQCAFIFSSNSSEALYGLALQMFLSSPANETTITRDVVSFLLVRGPYAWLGYGWQGCSESGPPGIPPQLLLDYGEPLNNVTETSHNVFERRWSKATVAMNCATMEASVQWV
jgi:hypothetical protein